MFPLFRPSLPEPCSCGKMHDEECPLVGFANHNQFPPFAEIPDIDEVHHEYYSRVTVDGYRPNRHWGLAGEIKETNFFLRPRALIETKYGEAFKVNFHLEGASEPTCFSWNDLKAGNTMVILQAESKIFMGGDCGIRQEHPGTRMVFPVPLTTLTDEYELTCTCLAAPGKACFNCGKPEAEGQSLRKCAKCKGALYCNKECQLKHWKRIHKRMCPSTSKLVQLASVEFSTFEHFLTWEFRAPLSFMDAGEIGAKMVELLSKLLDGIPNNSDTPVRLAGVENFKSSFIIKALKSFRDAVTRDPSARYHVVDQNGPISIDNDLGLLAIAYWQRFLGVAGLEWMFETETPIPPFFVAAMGYLQDFDTDMIAPGVYILRHAPSETLMYSFSFELVAFQALEVARERTDHVFIRVLQAPADPRASAMLSLAASTPRPPNVFDLWIRRSYLAVSNFHPINDRKGLVEALLDIRQGIGGSVFPDNAVVDNDELDQSQRPVRCSACGRELAKSSFSKNQLRKGPKKARCKSCVGLDQPFR